MSAERASGGHNGREWDSNPERWALRRARYIGRTTGLESTEARIVAFAELGYSHSGIAKHVDVSAGTVKAKFDEIDAVDPTALLSRRPDELVVESPIGVDGTACGVGE